jgi:hypothetical protein
VGGGLGCVAGEVVGAMEVVGSGGIKLEVGRQSTVALAGFGVVLVIWGRKRFLLFSFVGARCCGRR